MGHIPLWKRLDYPVVAGLASMHVLALGTLFPQLFSWSGVAWFVGMYIVTGMGITLCYHRLLTHSSFKTYKWLYYTLVIIGMLAWEGRPILWVGRHRVHHGHSDKEGDPHSPRHGTFWAHVFWVTLKNPKGDVLAMNTVKGDLLRDPVLVQLDKLFWLPQTIFSVAIFTLGTWLYDGQTGLSWLVWGVGLRTTFVYHVTWMVNSAAHLWGYRNFTQTDDDSRNNPFVAVFAFGEGWHNNHHAVPRSAAHGMRWFEFDPTYWVIRILETLGLVWDVVKPPPVARN